MPKHLNIETVPDYSRNYRQAVSEIFHKLWRALQYEAGALL